MELSGWCVEDARRIRRECGISAKEKSRKSDCHFSAFSFLVFIYQLVQMEWSGGGDFKSEGSYVFRTGKYAECGMNITQHSLLVPLCFPDDFY